MVYTLSFLKKFQLLYPWVKSFYFFKAGKKLLLMLDNKMAIGAKGMDGLA